MLPVFRAFLVAQLIKNLPAMWKTWVRSLGWKDPLEKGMATHSSILAWKIPWTFRDLNFPHSSVGKESACNAGDLGSIPGLGRSPGGGNGNPLSIPAWKIPWTEEPGGLQSMGSQEWHDLATKPPPPPPPPVSNLLLQELLIWSQANHGSASGTRENK